MSNRRRPAATKIRPEIRAGHRYVDTLRPGDVITGTGPSGPYEDGPVTLARLDPSPADSLRATAYRLHLTDGTSCVYYGDTIVTVEQVAHANV